LIRKETHSNIGIIFFIDRQNSKSLKIHTQSGKTEIRNSKLKILTFLFVELEFVDFFFMQLEFVD
jgi:hypothetical protein